MLTEFCEKSPQISTSKIKSINSYETIVKYLLLDLDSPEIPEAATKPDEHRNRDFKYKLIQQEIETILGILRKDKRAELIETKKKAKA